MIRHVVLITLNAGVAEQDPRVRHAVTAERDLTAVATSWRFGANPTGRRDVAHFVGIGDFPTIDELATFLAHPAHQLAARAWKDIATWHVGDIELTPSDVEGQRASRSVN